MNRERLWNGRSDRITHFIRRHPAVNIHHATRYAERLGLPLNRFVTINFSQTPCPESRASLSFRKLLTQRFAPWLRRSSEAVADIPPTYVWAMEGAGGQTAVHWLVHIPSGMYRAFERRLHDWIRSITGSQPEVSPIKVKPIRNLIGLKRYVLKGTEPVWARHLGVRPIEQGIVIGKRSGFSRNLGPLARTRGGYRPRRMPPTAVARQGAFQRQ